MSQLTPSQIQLMKMFNPSFDDTAKCALCERGLFDAGSHPPAKCEKCGQTDYCINCSWGVTINGVTHMYCNKHPMTF
jgi:hypothetical protein